MKRLLAILLCSCGLATGGEDYTIYFRQGTSTSAMTRLLAPLRAAVPQVECRYVVLEDNAETMAAAINSANALNAGVEELPSLVLSDDQGAYAAIPLPRQSGWVATA